MTNKVKPFFIRITEDMTPQMVQDAFNKCVDAGIKNGEPNDAAENLHDWNHFGVCREKGTRFYDSYSSFRGDAQEITLDQLDEWLGLGSKVEWDGEGLPRVGVECDILDVNGKETIGNGTIYHVDGDKFFILSESLKDYPEESTVNMFDGAMNLYVMWVSDSDDRFRKPETPEQKAERERLEAAYDLYTHVQSVRGQSSCGFDWFSNSEMEEIRLRFLAIVDKTNYRKR